MTGEYTRRGAKAKIGMSNGAAACGGKLRKAGPAGNAVDCVQYVAKKADGSS